MLNGLDMKEELQQIEERTKIEIGKETQETIRKNGKLKNSKARQNTRILVQKLHDTI